MLPVLKESKSFHKFISWFGLFSSFGTLLCCAIPSSLVLLGFGATLASFLGNFPQLIWLSENKEIVFGLSFLMLGLAFLGQRYAQTQVCPIDKKEDCETAKGWSKPIFWISFGINVVGAFYAFILPRIIG
ncbi:MAG TPA: hypothetical protein VNJ08_06890 [Bacteriovoracaceae bacterium]|nr:hypothetical protein [Bacteriovoracaceae bacterium]